MITNKTTTTVPIYRLRNIIYNSSTRMSSSDYKHAKTGKFTQPAPVLENPFTSDPILSRALKQLIPQQEFAKVSNDLTKFGERIVNEIDKLGYEAEIQPPQIQQFDAWGNRIDKLIVAPAWNRLKEISAEEGLIAIGYDKSVDPEYRRLHQMSKLYMFHPASGLVTCPLAMTDGAAKTINELKLGDKFPECKEAFERLTSRDPQYAWTSGQWMTEKGGGSDVGGGTDTFAEKTDGSNYNLYGYKWFSSAIDADMSLTLARSVENGQAQTGSRGLSLFYLRVRNTKNGPLNGLQMMRLKNKLGTRQLPTAELLLDGVKAIKVSEEGRGVPSIANMLNITRVHNAIASVAGMRRIVSLARDYSTRRIAFGSTLHKWPLHLKVLADLEIKTRAGLLLTLEATRLLGKQEGGHSSEQEALLLRLITPIVKLHTGKICVPAISEGIECFGGQGYIEDTGLPGILRDTQVTAIWEGTTNVLSLDVLRVFATTKFAAVQAFATRIHEIISKTKKGDEKLQKTGDALENALNQLLGELKNAQKATDFPQNLQRGARDISMTMGNIYSGALLTEFATHPDAIDNDKEVAYRYCTNQKLATISSSSFDASSDSIDKSIVFENYQNSKL